MFLHSGRKNNTFSSNRQKKDKKKQKNHIYEKNSRTRLRI